MIHNIDQTLSYEYAGDESLKVFPPTLLQGIENSISHRRCVGQLGLPCTYGTRKMGIKKQVRTILGDAEHS